MSGGVTPPPVTHNGVSTWPSTQRLAAVGVGGALGAAARWGIGDLLAEPMPVGSAWPWATLIANVVGCLLIGLAARRLERHTLSWDALVTGVLGGFTTMSAFAVELNDLAEAGRTSLTIGYLAATLVGGIGATWLASSAPSEDHDR